MFSIAGIDLLEQELLDHERTLLEILLQDKTTKKNIIWATDDYAEKTKQTVTRLHTKKLRSWILP